MLVNLKVVKLKHSFCSKSEKSYIAVLSIYIFYITYSMAVVEIFKRK